MLPFFNLIRKDIKNKLFSPKADLVSLTVRLDSSLFWTSWDIDIDRDIFSNYVFGSSTRKQKYGRHQHQCQRHHRHQSKHQQVKYTRATVTSGRNQPNHQHNLPINSPSGPINTRVTQHKIPRHHHKTTQRMNNSLSDHQYPRFYPITQTQITHSGESWWFIHLLKRWPKETVLSLSGNIVLIESKNSMTHWHSRWPRNFMLLSNLCVLPLHFLTHYNRTIWIQVFEFKYKSIYLLLDWLTAKKPNVQIHK